MARQLWVSPITGYRRRGTRLAELRKLVDTGLTARAVLEPLQSCPQDALANDMREVLLRKDFDIAGVQAAPDSSVIGYVERESLRNGHVNDHIRQITVANLVSESTPLPKLLAILAERKFVLVLVGPEVRGIVTCADMNKPPARLYLFGLISLLEMHLTFWARVRFTEGSIAKAVTPARLDAARRIQEERRASQGEMPLVDCLQFCDKRDVFLKLPDCLKIFPLPSKARARSLLETAEKLRDTLAHSQSSLSWGQSWTDLAVASEAIETVLQASDERIERDASVNAKPDNALWAAA